MLTDAGSIPARSTNLNYMNNKSVSVQQVCFVCTGNLYRSKYAEGVFNKLCIDNNTLNLRAFSRGLAVQHTSKYSHGESFTSPIRLALDSYDRIVEEEIPFCLIGPTNVMLTEYDCESSDVIVLMNHDEHMTKMKSRFPKFIDKVVSYKIGDKHYLPINGYDGPVMDAKIALDTIRNTVIKLYKGLS